MRLDRWCAIAGLLWLCALGGCARRPACHPCVGTPPPAAIPATPSPGPITVDWKSVLAADRPDVALTSASTAAGYRTLTEEQCRCWAIEQATLANMLDAERHLVYATQRDCHGKLRPPAELLVQLLASSAADARNDAAATATELFFRLAEARLQDEVLQRSLAEVDQARADFRQLQERGIALPTDESKLQAQRLDLVKRQSELQTAAQAAEGQLCRLLGLTPDLTSSLSPVGELCVNNEPIDAAQMIAVGMDTRADLAALRVLCLAYQRGQLAIVRRGLQQAHALIGSGTPEGGLLLTLLAYAHRCDEAPARGAQLSLAFADKTDAATAEIRQAVGAAEARRREAALMKQKWDIKRGHTAALEERRQVNGTTAFDVSAARLEALEAESGALAAVAAAKVAEIRLAKAVGVLATSCACPPPAAEFAVITGRARAQ